MQRRVDTYAQRATLPFGAIDHYDTLLIWAVTRETVGYVRGRPVRMLPVSGRSMSEIVGLSVASIHHRVVRLESVGLIERTPAGLRSTFKEVPIGWPLEESDSLSM